MSMTPLQGDLQMQVMKALWHLEVGTVERVRAALPVRYRGAYTTVQTVLNRLAERGLVSRERAGKTIEYRPRLTEAQYLARSIEQALAGASSEARHAALADVIGGLEPSELTDIQRRAKAIDRRRGKA